MAEEPRHLLIHAPGAETVIGLNDGVVVREGVVHVDSAPRSTLTSRTTPPG
jgi:hypothetical protein